MIKVFPLLLATASYAHGTSVTLPCTGSGGSLVVTSTVYFNNGIGDGSFNCSDAGLGVITLDSVSVSLFDDYQNADGPFSSAGPFVNSASFSYSSTAGAWAPASAGGNTTTMSLDNRVSQFSIGNLNPEADSFTNTVGGGLGSDGGATSVCPPGGGHACNFFSPTTDAQTALTGSFTINVQAFVDSGGFSQGVSSSRVEVTFVFNNPVPSSPEPASMFLFGSGILCLLGASRKTSARNS